MDNAIDSKILEKVMESPLVVDDLWQAKHGTPQDPHGLNACLRLDKLLGGTGKPDSDIAIELSYNAGNYIDFLMTPDEYPEHLKMKADREFQPFGKEPEWIIPQGFHKDGWFWASFDKLVNKQIQAKLRSRFSMALIAIDKPARTRYIYPWQQAVSANHTLAVWNPSTLEPIFMRISSCYIKIRHTKAYQVHYSQQGRECIKVPILIKPGFEQMFTFQTILSGEEKTVFDAFISNLA
ncbi:MAG: hypothetical protein ABSE89_03050 [Sedimentisphaerales bacterium]